jgi:hypothetical protein
MPPRFQGENAQQQKKHQTDQDQPHGHRLGVLQAIGREAFVDHHRRRHWVVGHDHHGAELADRPGRAHDDAHHHVPPGQRQGHPEEGAAGRSSQAAGDMLQPRRDLLEAGLDRVDVERQSDEGQHGDQAGDGAHDLDACRLHHPPDGVVAAGNAEQGDTHHRVGDHDGQVDDTFQDPLAREAAPGQQVGQGRPEHQGDDGRRAGGDDAEADGPDNIPVHHGFLEGGQRGLGHHLHQGNQDEGHDDGTAGHRQPEKRVPAPLAAEPASGQACAVDRPTHAPPPVWQGCRAGHPGRPGWLPGRERTAAGPSP